MSILFNLMSEYKMENRLYYLRITECALKSVNISVIKEKQIKKKIAFKFLIAPSFTLPRYSMFLIPYFLNFSTVKVLCSYSIDRKMCNEISSVRDLHLKSAKRSI